MDGVEQNIFTIHGGHVMKHDLPVFDITNIETDKALQSDIIAAEEEYGAYLFTGYDPKIEACLKKSLEPIQSWISVSNSSDRLIRSRLVV